MSLINQKILDIQKSIGKIEKNGTGPQAQGSYKFLAVDDVLERIKPLFDQAGVIVIPKLVNAEIKSFDSYGDPGNGRAGAIKVSTYAYLTYSFTLRAVEDGSEVEYIVIGEGSDSNDKAVRKATTQAQKIFLIEAFQLVTGEEDPDAVAGASGNETAVQAEAPKGHTAAKTSKLDTLRRNVKAAAGKKGVDSSTINAMGSKIDNDFFASEEALTKLLAEINALPEAE